MDAIEAILGRRTVPQAKMGGPGPSPDEIDLLLRAAAAAPDHGRLRPWRLLVVAGEGRAALGELCAEALRRRDANAPEDQLEKERRGPSRAPLVLVVVAAGGGAGPDAKVPEVERVASAAAAAQNVLLAAHAMGYAAKWSTGRNAYDPHVQGGLGLGPGERILGFLYVGDAAQPHDPPPRPGPAEVAARWPG